MTRRRDATVPRVSLLVGLLNRFQSATTTTTTTTRLCFFPSLISLSFLFFLLNYFFLPTRPQHSKFGSPTAAFSIGFLPIFRSHVFQICFLHRLLISLTATALLSISTCSKLALRSNLVACFAYSPATGRPLVLASLSGWWSHVLPKSNYHFCVSFLSRTHSDADVSLPT